MAYVRLDDSVMDNPKMLRLSDRAFRGWIWGLCYAQRHLTDGFLPLGALTAAVKRGTSELMARGLWAVADGGFQIHDYLEYQDSKEIVEGRKGRARDRMRDRRSDADSRVSERAPNVRANISETSREASLPSISLPPVSSYLEKGSGEKPHWDAEEFMDLFRAGWRRLYGYECSLIVKPLQYSTLQQQMAAIDEPRLCEALAAFFSTDDPYVRKNKHPLGLFLADPLKFLASALAPAPEAGKLTTRLASAVANIHAEAK